MTVTYQTAGGGHLDIDFILKGPGGKVMADQRRQVTGTYSFTAEVDGRYHYSFSNAFSTVTGKTLRFAFVLHFRNRLAHARAAASMCTVSCTSRTTDTPHRSSAKSEPSPPPSKPSRMSKSTSSCAKGSIATVGRSSSVRNASTHELTMFSRREYKRPSQVLVDCPNDYALCRLRMADILPQAVSPSFYRSRATSLTSLRRHQVL